MKLLFATLIILFSTSVIGQNVNYTNDEISNDQCGMILIDQEIYLDSLQTDDYTIKSISIVNNCIEFYVSFGGGCGTTNFELITDNAITESMAPTIRVFLKLTDNDICEAIRYRKVSFDVSGYESYKEGMGLTFVIIDSDKTVMYKE